MSEDFTRNPHHQQEFDPLPTASKALVYSYKLAFDSFVAASKRQYTVDDLRKILTDTNSLKLANLGICDEDREKIIQTFNTVKSSSGFQTVLNECLNTDVNLTKGFQWLNKPKPNEITRCLLGMMYKYLPYHTVQISADVHTNATTPQPHVMTETFATANPRQPFEPEPELTNDSDATASCDGDDDVEPDDASFYRSVDNDSYNQWVSMSEGFSRRHSEHQQELFDALPTASKAFVYGYKFELDRVVAGSTRQFTVDELRNLINIKIMRLYDLGISYDLRQNIYDLFSKVKRVSGFQSVLQECLTMAAKLCHDKDKDFGWCNRPNPNEIAQCVLTMMRQYLPQTRPRISEHYETVTSNPQPVVLQPHVMTTQPSSVCAFTHFNEENVEDQLYMAHLNNAVDETSKTAVKWIQNEIVNRCAVINTLSLVDINAIDMNNMWQELCTAANTIVHDRGIVRAAAHRVLSCVKMCMISKRSTEIATGTTLPGQEVLKVAYGGATDDRLSYLAHTCPYLLDACETQASLDGKYRYYLLQVLGSENACKFMAYLHSEGFMKKNDELAAVKPPRRKNGVYCSAEIIPPRTIDGISRDYHFVCYFDVGRCKVKHLDICLTQQEPLPQPTSKHTSTTALPSPMYVPQDTERTSLPSPTTSAEHGKTRNHPHS